MTRRVAKRFKQPLDVDPASPSERPRLDKNWRAMTDKEKLEECERVVYQQFFRGKDLGVLLSIEYPKHAVLVKTGRLVGANKRPDSCREIPAAQYDPLKMEAFIHPLLFIRKVPKPVLCCLIHHEVLHSQHKPVDGNPHSPAFIKAEARCPWCTTARQWLKRNGFPATDADHHSDEAPDELEAACAPSHS